MRVTKQKYFVWWVMLLVVTSFLLGCGADSTIDAESSSAGSAVAEAVEREVREQPPAEQDASGAAQPTGEPSDSALAGAGAEPEPRPTEIPVEEELVNDDDLIVGDDRSERLRSLTSSWNTDWERRTIDTGELLSGGPPRDGIPSIDAPQFVTFDEAAEWLRDREPVIALEINGDARAYPLQIMTWHEIANDTVGDTPVLVTFCPLCNAALVFERRLNGEVYEFGTSGLLRNSDLVMYDRTTETLWQQFTGQAIVGDLAGAQLDFLSSSVASFADFRAAHPEGVVLSRETGNSRPYGNNPYAGYDTYDNPLSLGGELVLFQGEQDDRLPPAERVVAVSLAESGIDVAYPLTILSEVGVINDTQGGQDIVVFHKSGTASALGAEAIAEGQDVGATGVFIPVIDGETLTFTKESEDIVDEQTGSSWNIFGEATAGRLTGEALEPVVHGNYFWFSWAAFKPDTIIYSR